MEFLRVYLQNDGNIKRGGISDKTTGKLVPDDARAIWFNGASGMIAQVDQHGTAFYAYTNIQGDSTFLVRCFRDHFEKKSFEELIGSSKPVVRKVVKKVIKKKR